MNRLTKTIPDNSSPFGSKPQREVFVPRFPLVNKVTGNLGATHRKMRIAEEKKIIEQHFNQIVGMIQYKAKNAKSNRAIFKAHKAA